jgi:SAM-dependent methyltransferase
VGYRGTQVTDSCDEHLHNLSTFYADPGLLLARQSSQAAGTAAEDLADWVLDLLGGVAGLEVLDAGAGVGRFTTRLTRLADPSGTVVALDLFSPMLETVRSRVRPTPRLALVNGGIDHLPFRENTFDLVFANHVLYHLREIAVRTGFCSATDASPFSLENGAAILAAHFDDVEACAVTDESARRAGQPEESV